MGIFFALRDGVLTFANDLGKIAESSGEHGAMGGSGSGNYYHWWRPSKKTVAEACLSLDANRWMREGILRAGIQRSGSVQWSYRDGRQCSISFAVVTLERSSPLVHLSYKRTQNGTEETETLDYGVRLVTTRPRFGGLRWWFVCPLAINGRTCNRRVGKLYLPPRGRYFGCRHCYDLTYTTCQESRKHTRFYRHLAASMGYDLATVRRMMNRMGKGPL
jgi:hypothetical protein